MEWFKIARADPSFMKTRSMRIKGVPEKECPRWKRNAFIFLLILGISFIAISFASELNFHYLQGFMPSNVSEDIFWKAENAEVFNSMIFLLVGIGFTVVAIVFLVKINKKS